MIRYRTHAAWLLALLMIAGCASTKTTQRQYYQGRQLPKPDRILVYDFTADPAQVPPQSIFAKSGAISSNPMTAQERDVTIKLGSEVARRVTANLDDAGLPAVLASGQPAPRVNDVAIYGYFVSVDEGSTAKRMLVGFGSGNASLTTAVEGFQMTANGLRQLGSGTVQSGSNKAPGMVLPLAMMAATANPIGLVVGGTLKLAGEATGNSTVEGNAKRTADLISEQLIAAAKRQGWK